MERFPGYKKWLVLWTATGINFIAGLLYIWSVISKGLVSELHWSSKQASLPYTIAIVCFVVAMVIFGKLQDARGPRITATISGVLIGGGLMLSALSSDPLLITLAFGVITGTGIGISNVSTTPPAVKWFPPERKGMITGIVVAGVGIASVFYSPLTNYLIKTAGISRTFLYIGAGALVSVVVLAQFLVNPPRSLAVNAGKNPGSFGSDMKWRDMLKTGGFYKLWIMLAFSSSAGLMIIGHTANITKAQVGWEGGFLLVILLAVFNAGGRLLGGTISDKIGRIALMRIAFGLQAANMLFFANFTSVGLLAVGIAIAGLCYGMVFSVFPAAVLDFYGVKHFGSNYGLIMTAWGTGGIIGPMTAAAIFDSTGRYNMAYYIASGLLLMAMAITFSFRNSHSRASAI